MPKKLNKNINAIYIPIHAAKTSPEIEARCIQVATVEFVEFFNAMLTRKEGWPALRHDVFVRSLASALHEVGKKDQLGMALLQAFIYEMQDHLTTHATT